MANQRGFDNQRSDLVSASEAAKLLGVKLQTLYAYASRGLLGDGTAGPGHRARYARDAVLRLKTRAAARAGHTAVAASALRWGEPVLDTKVSALTPDGPLYRGINAVSLVHRGTTFEQAAELLWTGVLPLQAPRWTTDLPMRPARGLSLAGLVARSAALGLEVGPRLSTTLNDARSLIVALAGGSPLARALLGRHATAAQIRLADAALVLSADHELNASTFAARVAASTGAPLSACFTAALATLSGPRHGGATDRVEALAVEAEAHGARSAVRARLERGEVLPGFERGAYDAADPRSAPLLERSRRLNPKRVAVLFELIEAVKHLGGSGPAVDFALVAAARALELPPGGGALLFALGRTAGWAAHVFEQQETGALIRPRARYVGLR